MTLRRFTVLWNGFTLVELILIVALLAILASIAVPRVGWNAMGSVQSETAARQFSNYLKLARSLAVTHASVNSAGYKLVLSQTRPYTYMLVDSNTSEVVKGPIDLPEGVERNGDRTFQFTPLGNLSVSNVLEVEFSKASDTTIVSVTPTGKVSIR